ncbi:hypothetical protein MNV49_005682 [Pseudohyphozyma bogoriensis]|nr:hypothetical protein MNV49_005682 [Pseudohyphozyma bogoriensis]
MADSDLPTAPSSTPAAPSIPSTAQLPTPAATPTATTRKPMKKANRPYTVQQRWKAERAAKAAAGERTSPVGAAVVRGVVWWTFVAFVTSCLVSRMVTESWLWGRDEEAGSYGRKLNREVVRLLLSRPREILLNDQELAMHDGTHEGFPIFIAIDGDVYDVSAAPKTYGPGGGYSFFAGKDAARAYVTGCFKDHLTHDLRGLSEKELASLEGWKQFYKNHKKYFKVGHVLHQAIPEDAPIPAPCK